MRERARSGRSPGEGRAQRECQRQREREAEPMCRSVDLSVRMYSYPSGKLYLHTLKSTASDTHYTTHDSNTYQPHTRSKPSTHETTRQTSDHPHQPVHTHTSPHLPTLRPRAHQQQPSRPRQSPRPETHRRPMRPGRGERAAAGAAHRARRPPHATLQ